MYMGCSNEGSTSPRARTEMAAIAEFEEQDWVKPLTGGNSPTAGTGRKHVNSNVAFSFQDNFLVATIHGANATAKPVTNEVVEIQDDEDDVSVLTTKTRAETQSEVVVGSRATTGSNPVVGPTANSTQTETNRGGSPDPTSAGPASGNAGGPEDK
jgi:hypothetical protein